MDKQDIGKTSATSGWTFLTNHSHVLICLVQDPYSLMREISLKVGITERAVQRIIADLEKAGVIKRIKDGRRNRYQIDFAPNLRHPLESDRTVGEFLAFMR
ncbi:MAG: winged helix-turn-helix transcriptional regulator [Armatimonadetes bacterium]|nr:winged helix-turn-helix transcriptional regulator [Armatimonadota bacterium]